MSAQAARRRLDAARLVRLAVESAPAGWALHAVAEEGVRTRAIAEAIGAGAGLPVVSVPADQADDHFGWLGRLFGMDSRASNRLTRELLDWEPIHASLLDDLQAGYYFRGQDS